MALYKLIISALIALITNAVVNRFRNGVSKI